MEQNATLLLLVLIALAIQTLCYVVGTIAVCIIAWAQINILRMMYPHYTNEPFVFMRQKGQVQHGKFMKE